MSLKAKVIQGVKWRSIVDISQQVLQIGFTIILARLLSKTDFGLVGMALLVNRFFVTVTNIGFGTAIIQSQTITNAQVSAIFYIQITLNIVLSSIVFFGSEVAANFFEEPNLIPIIEALSVIIFLQTFRFPVNLMSKKMDFKGFSIAELISMLIANTVAICLAFLDYGVWSLVWRLIIQRVIFGILCFKLSGWLPIKPEFKGTKPIFNFGINILGSKILYYFSENLIAILTGKYIGKEMLGVFNIAYNLAIKPSVKVQSILTSVLTSAFPKIQNNIEKFRKNHIFILSKTALFFLPLMALLAATSESLVMTFYGEKWIAVANILLFLCAVGALKGINHLLKNAIITKGNSRAILHSTIIEVIFSFPLMYFLLPRLGINGLIAAYFIGSFSGWLFLMKKYDDSIEQKGAIKSIFPSFLKSVVIFLLVYSLNFVNFSKEVILVLQILSGSIIFISILWIFNRADFLLIINKIKIRRLLEKN